MAPVPREKRNVAILVTSQTLFIIAKLPLTLLVALATLWFSLKAKPQLASQVSGPHEP